VKFVNEHRIFLFNGSDVHKRLALNTKLRMYQTLVLSVLLYAANTWTLLADDVRTLGTFDQKCLRWLIGIRCCERVWNNEVL